MPLQSKLAFLIRAHLPLFLIISLGMVLRGLPLLLSNGRFAEGDYDEGVYYSASALTWQGLRPYADFVFLHPPGIIVALAPLSVLASVVGHREAFGFARLAMVLLGGVNIFLVGRLGIRWTGSTAGLFGAATYATYFGTVTTERSLLLEPLLICLSLLAAAAWLPHINRPLRPRRDYLTGALLALASSMKLWGGFVVVAALASLRFERQSMRRVRRLGVGLGIGTMLVTGPFLQEGPMGYIEQVFAVHMRRPPDRGGVVRAATRIYRMFQYGPIGTGNARPVWLAAVILCTGIGLASWAWYRQGHHGRFWATLWALVVVAFLTSPTYFSHYGAFLALPTSVLFGAGASSWIAAVRTRHPRGAFLVVVLLALLPTMSAARVTRQQALRPAADEDFSTSLASVVTPRDCLFTDSPDLAILAGRLPQGAANTGMLVDPYGAQLLAATQSGQKFPTVEAALLSPVPQTKLRAELVACEFFATKEEPSNHRRWSDETEQWFLSRFQPHLTLPTRGGPQLWEQHPRS